MLSFSKKVLLALALLVSMGISGVVKAMWEDIPVVNLFNENPDIVVQAIQNTNHWLEWTDEAGVSFQIKADGALLKQQLSLRVDGVQKEIVNLFRNGPKMVFEALKKPGTIITWTTTPSKQFPKSAKFTLLYTASMISPIKLQRKVEFGEKEKEMEKEKLPVRRQAPPIPVKPIGLSQKLLGKEKQAAFETETEEWVHATGKGGVGEVNVGGHLQNINTQLLTSPYGYWSPKGDPNIARYRTDSKGVTEKCTGKWIPAVNVIVPQEHFDKAKMQPGQWVIWQPNSDLMENYRTRVVVREEKEEKEKDKPVFPRQSQSITPPIFPVQQIKVSQFGQKEIVKVTTCNVLGDAYYQGPAGPKGQGWKSQNHEAFSIKDRGNLFQKALAQGGDLFGSDVIVFQEWINGGWGRFVKDSGLALLEATNVSKPVALAFKQKTFTLVNTEQGNIVPADGNKGGSYIAAVLKNNNTQKDILVFGVHFDGAPALNSRESQWDWCFKRIGQMSAIVNFQDVIFLGDLNWTSNMTMLQGFSNVGFNDIFQGSNISTNINARGQNDSQDHIFYTNNILRCVAYEVAPKDSKAWINMYVPRRSYEQQGSLHFSDHAIVSAIFEIQ